VSTTQDPLQAPGAPGWFGKLPGMGDFAHRRLPEAFRDTWDRWLQTGFARLRLHCPDWTDRYLKAPMWCFVLGLGVVGNERWIGVLMPSVDGVGRYFPFTIAAELITTRTELQGEELARARSWWATAAHAALEGLEKDLDAVRFEVLLHHMFGGPSAMDTVRGGPDLIALPMVGQSLWFTDPTGAGGLGMSSQGLPEDEQFEALFSDAPGAPAPEPEPP